MGGGHAEGEKDFVGVGGDAASTLHHHQGCRFLGTDNDSNLVRLYGPGAGKSQQSPHTKDAFHRAVTGDGCGDASGKATAMEEKDQEGDIPAEIDSPLDSPGLGDVGGLVKASPLEGTSIGPECTKAAAWCVETLMPGQQLRVRTRFRIEGDVLAR